MAYTYDDFLQKANAAGMLESFDQKDLDIAKNNPEYGLSLLSLRKDAANATTPEQKLLAAETENQLRKTYGAYNVPKPSSFSYDKEDDPAFQNYEQVYTQAGEQAEDTVLQKADAMSAGRTPDYLKGVADQAGNYYRTQLGDAIPSLEQAAYQRYLNDKALRETESALGEAEQRFDYDPSTDPSWSAYRSAYMRELEREVENNLARNAARTGGRVSSAAVAAALQGASDNARQMAAGVNSLEKNAYSRYLSERAKELEEKAESMKTADTNNTTGAGWDNGDLTEEEIKQLQTALGVEVDGKYGPISKEAAFGLDARTAYNLFVANGAGVDVQEQEGSVVYDWQSLLNLGYPPSTTAEDILDLIESGEVEPFTEGNVVKFRRPRKITAAGAPSALNKPNSRVDFIY